MTEPAWLLLAVAAAVMSMAMLARAQRRMLLAGGTRVPMHRMVELTYAANAVNWTLPAGTALSAGYVAQQLRRWGASGAAAGFTIAASGVLSTATFAALAVSGSSVGGPAAIGTVVTPVLLVAAIGVVFMARRHGEAMIVLAERAVGRLMRLARRDPAAARAAVRGFVADLAAIHPRRRDWALGLLFAAGNWVADLVCLFACFRAVGIPASNIALVLITYVVGMTASSISLLPGGIGVVDVAMIATLSGAGGVSAGTATAVVVAYRVISCALVVAIGWGCWFALRRVSSEPRTDRAAELSDELVSEVEYEPEGRVDAPQLVERQVSGAVA